MEPYRPRVRFTSMSSPSPTEQQQPLAEDYLDGMLSPPERADFEARLAVDPGLREWIVREQQVRAAMRSMPAPAMRAGFARAALSRAAGRRPGAAMRTWVPSALAAGFALVALVGSWNFAPRNAGTEPVVLAAPGAMSQLRRVELSLGKVELLQLKIQAPGDFERVRFTLSLPQHVALAERPGTRQLTWEGSLRGGVNVLALPLMGEQVTTGRLKATVEVEGFQQTLEAELAVRSGKGAI